MALRKVTAALFAVLALTATAAIGPAAPAAAATDLPDPALARPGHSHGHHPGFTAAAEEAGLDDDEAEELQRQVDHYVARQGGIQVALNRVAVAGMGEIVLPLPGARQARADCPAQNFCMFTGPDFTGAQFNLYRCATYTLENWTGDGSWINNQTPGTRARFLDHNRNTIHTTPGAYSASSRHDWDPVWYVVNC
ncbi:peptidase inhibitor family I36 protein [Streptomyces sp. NPDC013953]|uniref:peptidase inhibitor family I36 protein n=1 Tax=Streptomyces sp. NPDC013953 TaxID=3364868 RepID=UPI0036FEB082